MLRLNLPTSTTVKSVVYGVPRVGNAPYAAFFDSSNVRHFVPVFDLCSYNLICRLTSHASTMMMTSFPSCLAEDLASRT
jgi:hypothetical protein